MDELNMLKFNDDNHAERIWINGKYVGDTSSIFRVITNSIDIIKDLNDNYKVKCDSVYVCDDFEDCEEEKVDEIWEFFNNADYITEEQRDLIYKRDWDGLCEII